MSRIFSIGGLSREEEKSRAGVETINLASVQLDDISVAVISTVRMCECEIYEASSLMLVGHLRLFVLHQDERDKRNVCTYRSSEITTVIRDPLMMALHASFT